MSRLFGSLSPSSPRRYFSALDAVPGVVSPGVGVLTLQGQQPVAVEPTTAFRTPATALLTLSGLPLASPSVLTPAPANIAMGSLAPGLVTQLTISPALPAPAYDTPQGTPPTLITIWTTQPGVGLLTLQPLEQNVTQGGNIGFVSPATGQLSLQTRDFTLLLLAGGVGTGLLTLTGHAPTLQRELTIEPEAGLVSMGALAPTLGLPFGWVDDDPAPAVTWIADAAA